MQAVANADDLWGVLAVIVTTIGGVVVAWLTSRASKSSAEKDTAVEPVIEEARKVVNLRPAVEAMAEQIAELQEEMAKVRPIAKIKYPLALNTIANFQAAHPTSTVKIPHQLKDDL